jgi:hypothetical protein
MIFAFMTHILHWAVLAFVLVGWALPWKLALWFHALLIPALVVHWLTNDHRCVLTEMEEKFKASAKAPERPPNEESFTGYIIRKLTGKTLSEKALAGVSYGVMKVVWILTVLRLMNGARAF